MTNFKILDCTLRDGSYYNNWDFPIPIIDQYLDALSSCNIDIVELGLRSASNNRYKGALAFTSEVFLEKIKLPPDLKIGVMVNAAEFVDLDFNKLKLIFPLDKTESKVDLVRIATHYSDSDTAFLISDYLKNKGFSVGVNLMQISEYGHNEITEFSIRASMHMPDVLYFADSLGTLKPPDIGHIVGSIREHWNYPVGIHSHDNMGLALENLLTARELGVTWFDSTVTGMGRGPGNVKTEELLIEVDNYFETSRNIVPLLRVIEDYFLPLQNYYKWGKNFYYYLAGKYSVHPSYIQEMLSDSRYEITEKLSVINHFANGGGNRFNSSKLNIARDFYLEEPRGRWSPREALESKNILLLGSGPSVKSHMPAIIDYISNHQPIVFALNTSCELATEYVDYRLACHPVRILADSKALNAQSNQIITPYSMLPPNIIQNLDKTLVLDYGLKIESNTFTVFDKYCVLPSILVLAYSLAVATAGHASRVLLAGFDGYPLGDPRNDEVNKVFSCYNSVTRKLPIISITNTLYKVPTVSIYGNIDF